MTVRSFIVSPGMYFVGVNTDTTDQSFIVAPSVYITDPLVAVVADPDTAGITFVGTETDTSSASTYTFSDVDIGDAHAQRTVFIGCSWGQSTLVMPMLAATIGGILATINVQAASTEAVGRYAAIISARVPTGTTATVVIVLAAQATRMHLAVYRAIHAGRIVDVARDTAASANVLTFNLNTVSEGAALAVVSINTTAGTTSTWTGLTETYDEDIETVQHVSGALETELAGGVLAVTHTAAADLTQNVMVGLSLEFSEGNSGVRRLAQAEAERRRSIVYHRQQENLKYNLEALRLQRELAEKKARLAEEEKNKNAESRRADGLRKQAAALEAKLAKIVERERRRIEAELALQMHNAEVMTVLAAVM